MYPRGCFAATRVRTDVSWRRVLEVAADRREAAPRHGARYQPTNRVGFESPLGARREATQGGGGSQPEERQGMAVEVHMLIRRRKNHVRGFLNGYSLTHHLLRSGKIGTPSRYPVIDRLRCLYFGHVARKASAHDISFLVSPLSWRPCATHSADNNEIHFIFNNTNFTAVVFGRSRNVI
jgi:hypothetical protein